LIVTNSTNKRKISAYHRYLILIPVLFLSFTWGGTTGKISGRIIDKATGESLIGCNIIVIEEGLGAATDLNGYYNILNIPPGTYTVKCMMIGYTNVNYTNVTVNADFTTTMDFQLSIAVIAGEEITVIAEKPIITKDLTSSRATISGERISEMPVEEIGDVLELQAGIVRGSDNKIHIRGGRASEVVYLIDGISVSDPFSGDISVEV
jgi:hypothetical protein